MGYEGKAPEANFTTHEVQLEAADSKHQKMLYSAADHSMKEGISLEI